jgi:hypothetical protein
VTWRRLLVAVGVAPSLFAWAPMTAEADQPTPASYRQAVSDAYAIVSHASPGDVQAAVQATNVLETGTQLTQPEVVADLAQRPPDFTDAATRLQALLDAIDTPASTEDPASAQAKLHDVLAMHRYDALHRPPSALDRLSQWFTDRVRDLLRFLFGGSSIGGVVPLWVVYAIGVLAIAAVAFILLRSARGRFGGEFAAAAAGGPGAPADFFADADRLAAAGNGIGAIRALCAGVAATLAGERTWEGSPLTVREIFQRAPDPAALRPLLLPFEAAVYGGRDVDAATYERAAAVASRFRVPVEKAA